MRDHRFTFPLANGLHARPASHLAEQTAAFSARIEFHNERGAGSADARSVLELVSTNTQSGDPCRMTFEGVDEDAAHRALARWLEQEFPGCDDAPEAEIPVSKGKIPRALRELGIERSVVGIPVSPGIGVGVVVAVGRGEIPESAFPAAPGLKEDELRRYEEAIAALSAEYDTQIAGAQSRAEREIVNAHRSLLRDPALAGRIKGRISDGASAARAAQDAIGAFAKDLSGASSAYLRERVLDLRDVGDRLVRKILGISSDERMPSLEAPSVVVAESLTPAEFLQLDRSHLRAVVIGDGGTTSHTILLAKSFGVPTICGLGGDISKLAHGGEVIADARAGVVILQPIGRVRAHYDRRLEHEQRMAKVRANWARMEARTADGERIQTFANIASAEEAQAAFESGADGIGLFRTEMLFVGNEPPNEDQQFEIYETVVRAAAGRPVTFRTLDVGGDKPVPGMTIGGEENPFLGRRGVRLYAEHAGIVKAQLRAMLRAAIGVEGVKIMFPMISCVEEMRFCHELFAEAKSELIARDAPPGEVEVGMMIEVPAAAFAIPELAEHAEFFSIGSNDLAQYFMAANRGDSALATLHSPFHPPFVRLLKQVIDGAAAANRSVGICGGIAGESSAQALLIGLGLRQLSMPAPVIAAAKAALVQIEVEACCEIAEAALACADESAARIACAELRRVELPWIEPALVRLDIPADSKAGVIREMIDALECAGRVESADALEEAVWTREETYATGFGNGFAIPHAKTEAVKANSIVVARLDKAIEWGSIDEGPVRIILMMAVRESQKDAHLRSLAKLSRLLMREEFQRRLEEETSDEALAAFILDSLA